MEEQEGINRNCAEVTNASIGITSVNALGQKLSLVEVTSQHERKLLTKIKIALVKVV